MTSDGKIATPLPEMVASSGLEFLPSSINLIFTRADVTADHPSPPHRDMDAFKVTASLRFQLKFMAKTDGFC